MLAFDFSTFPTLITPRLVLREIVPGDAAALYNFLSDPEVQKYDVDAPWCDISESYRWIEEYHKWFEEKKAIIWGVVVKDENRMVGRMAFMFWEKRYESADLGYTMARPYWRRGIATEAVRAMLQFGFESMRVHRVNVDTRMDNLGSLLLMQTLGFRPEGERRECIRNADGTYQSWGLFGMLEDEYRLANS
jgi:[ribosomal protein S5]-alanine N-acetyltransferase